HVVRSKEIFEASIPAGHFGLVVGSRALDRSWPLVLDWMRWREGKGTRPRVLREEDPPVEIEDAAFAEDDFDVRLFVDAAKDVAGSAWRAVGELIEDAGQYGQNLRYQLPRLAELEALTDTTRVSLSRTLAQRAVESPGRTFFLWRGRAFTYEDSNRRVDAVVRGLWHVGVRPGSRVAVVMGPRPSLLTAVAALSRIGAVSVLIREAADSSEVQRSMDLAGADLAIVDPERAERLLSVCMGGVYVLGGGQDRRVAEGAFDLEALDVEGIELPTEFVADPLCGGDLSNVFFSPARTGDGLRLSRISARRWAASAIGAAAACTLSPDDTVYSALPLHHIGGLLVSVGGAMVGGARLALADSESSGFPPVLGKPTAFWDEVRRYGATVVFYAGDAARSLVDAPRASRDRSSPVRLFAGSGMRAGVWRQLQDRFGASVVEFYASSEVPAILANMTGLKVGSVGVPLPGSSEVALARFDARGIERERGRAQRTADGEWGMLLVRLEPSDECDEGRLEVDVFEHEDRWLRTGDVLLRDVDGDYHFMGRERDVLQAGGRWASLREVEDALDAVDGVRIAVADMSTGVPRVRIVLREDAPTMSALRKALAHLPAPLDVAALEIVQPEAIRFTAGYRPLR
ncbi:MAG: AMP-binding protein, partial [Myxococcota bacterium]